jgi:hypothetical protein
LDAFAILQADGSIMAWGSSSHGGTGAPSGSDYTKIYSNGHAFAALKVNGSISAWGDSSYGGAGAPSGSGYTKIYGAPIPPEYELPHAVIEPSALRATKAPSVE